MSNHVRRIAIAAALAFLSASSHAQPAQPSVRARVDEIFRRWTPSTPGCAIGVDVKGEPVVRAAYGMADLEREAPNTPETIFETGSVAKQFTATAVLLLARDGKLSLDDPVRRYIPELPVSAAAVTIRQMLQHTSGLRDWGNVVNLTGWPRGTRVHTHAHVLDILGAPAGAQLHAGDALVLQQLRLQPRRHPGLDGSAACRSPSSRRSGSSSRWE